jgi:asparagine synthase (glutamine-hydrolysing)
MLHGVEIRMPFMDYRVVTFGLSLPAHSKVKNGRTKAHIRAAMTGIVPNAVLADANKIGLAAPLSDWFTATGAEFMSDIVSSRAFLESDVWNGARVRALVESKRGGGGWTRFEAQRVWRTLSAYAILNPSGGRE